MSLPGESLAILVALFLAPVIALHPWSLMGEGMTGLYLRLADCQFIE